MSRKQPEQEAIMDANLKIQMRAEGEQVTMTYSRVDLCIETAVVTGSRDGRWSARLYDGPEEQESTREVYDREAAADRAAVQHSLSF